MVQFTALADTYDAVADVVLAEAVHQTLAANPSEPRRRPGSSIARKRRRNRT